MASSDIYEKLAIELYKNDFFADPGIDNPEFIVTPEFIEILKLQYTPEEAQLALQVGFSGQKLDKLVDITSIEEGQLKRMLNTMAEKGTMWIDPESEAPNYRSLLVVSAGISENAAWIDQYPYSGELKKRWNKYVDVWVDEVCGPHFPIAQAWAAVGALPPDANPSEDVSQVIKQLGYWAVAKCSCRSFKRADESDIHCDHLLETCMHFGDIGRWVVEYGHGREITYEEALDIIRKCEEDGLVHNGPLPYHGILCGCCSCSCSGIRRTKRGLPHFLIPSPFIATCDEDTCIACRVCVDRCPVGAIKVDEVATVDRDTCIGCGLCVVGCDADSMRLERRPQAEGVETRGDQIAKVIQQKADENIWGNG